MRAGGRGWATRSCVHVVRSSRRISRSASCASCSSGDWRAPRWRSARRCSPGPAGAVRPLLLGELVGASAFDTSFAVLHGLYWLAANLADRRPLLIAVDDAHWADEPSLRWLAYLAPRLEGLAVVLLVALRPGEAALTGASLLALRAEASAVVRPALLSEGAVGAIVRAAVGGRASDELCAAVWAASGGNPLYLTELLRAVELDDRPLAELDPAELLAGGREGIARRVLARVRGLDPRALGLAQALAVLGDGCELRHAAAIAGVEMADATRLAARPRSARGPGRRRPSALHPPRCPRRGRGVAGQRRARRRPSLRRPPAPRGWGAGGTGRRASRRRAARGRSLGAGPLAGGRAGGDGKRRAAGRGRPVGPRAGRAAPARGSESASCARRLARRRARGARRRACNWRRRCGSLPIRGSALRSRSRSPKRTRRCFGGWMRWMSSNAALAELGEADEALAARLEGELVVCGLHDARRASRVAPVLERLSSRPLAGSAAEALAVAQGMAMVLAGRPADEAAAPLEEALSRAPRARGELGHARRAAVESGHRRALRRG